MLRQAFRSSFSSSLRTATAATRFPGRATQVRLLSQESRAKLQAAVKEHPLVVFMKGTPQSPQCGFSRAVVQVLDINGVPPEKLKTYDVIEDWELRTDIKEFSEWPTVPQVYVNGEFVGGCDIILGMHQSGELENLLRENNIIAASETKDTDAPATS